MMAVAPSAQRRARTSPLVLLLARALVGLATRHAAAEIRLVAALRLLVMLLTVLLALLGPVLLRLLGAGHGAIRSFVVAHVTPLGPNRGPQSCPRRLRRGYRPAWRGRSAAAK